MAHGHNFSQGPNFSSLGFDEDTTGNHWKAVNRTSQCSQSTKQPNFYFERNTHVLEVRTQQKKAREFS